MAEAETIEEHLEEALSHLEQAMNLSLQAILQKQAEQKEIGFKWELFLGRFFGYAREQGKKYRVNLFSLVSFPRSRY